MDKKNIQSLKFSSKPLTPSVWDDFEKLFGERGACGGCWCMNWRLTRGDFVKGKGKGNRAAMKRIVSRGVVPGVIGYIGKEPVAWCSIGPREDFSALERSRVLARIDDEKVWSITCLFVSKGYRKQGVSELIIKEAVRYAFSKKAKIVEAYPFDIDATQPDPFVWTGLSPAYRRAGFKEAARRSRRRPIFRIRCS